MASGALDLRDDAPSGLETVPDDPLEVALDGLAFGHLEPRELEPLPLEIHVHPLGDRERIVVGLLIALRTGPPSPRDDLK